MSSRETPCRRPSLVEDVAIPQRNFSPRTSEVKGSSAAYGLLDVPENDFSKVDTRTTALMRACVPGNLDAARGAQSIAFVRPVSALFSNAATVYPKISRCPRNVTLKFISAR